MNQREKWVTAISFLKNKNKNPSELLHNRDWESLSAVLGLVRSGLPLHYAMSDSNLYKRIMLRIIDLRIEGWGNPRWEMYDLYAADPTLFERCREHWKRKAFPSSSANFEEKQPEDGLSL